MKEEEEEKRKRKGKRREKEERRVEREREERRKRCWYNLILMFSTVQFFRMQKWSYGEGLVHLSYECLPTCR